MNALKWRGSFKLGMGGVCVSCHCDLFLFALAALLRMPGQKKNRQKKYHFKMVLNNIFYGHAYFMNWIPFNTRLL